MFHISVHIISKFYAKWVELMTPCSCYRDRGNVREKHSPHIGGVVAQCLGESFPRFLLHVLKTMGGVCINSQTGTATPCGVILKKTNMSPFVKSYYTFELL